MENMNLLIAPGLRPGVWNMRGLNPRYQRLLLIEFVTTLFVIHFLLIYFDIHFSYERNKLVILV